MKEPVLVGDIGGTNTRLAIYCQGKLHQKRSFPSRDYPSLEEIIGLYLEEVCTPAPGLRPCEASLAAAGPVQGRRIAGTNLQWDVDASQIERTLGFERVVVLNDFAAAAWGLFSLDERGYVQIGRGRPEHSGNIAVLGPGTGLGEAVIVKGQKGRWVIATEGGHCDFAPTTPVEAEIWAYLSQRYDHVSVERVVSGPGLVNLIRFFAKDRPMLAGLLDARDPSAALSEKASDGDADCLEIINTFCSILGAEAGNLALKSMATGGVFIAGGIAPKILNILKNSPFRRSFEAKGRMSGLLSSIPTYVVTESEIGLKGAGFYWELLKAEGKGEN